MKKIFLSLLVLPTLLFAQYYYERSTEQNFETSDFYFSRYFFNPFGMGNFKEITPGLIENSFLDIFINPSRVTNLKERFNFYIDYRGERTSYKPEIFGYPIPLAEPNIISVDYVRPYPYFITQARLEPEPKFSIGIIGSPFNSLSDKFFVGAVFQRIHKAEKFYSMPYWIYYPIRGYDPFGNRFIENDFIPSSAIDRYSGKDEMVTSANLFSFFTGYRLSKTFSLGFQISGINHDREGGFRDKYNDDYGNIDNNISQSDYLINRIRDYRQIEYTFGLTFSEEISKVGVKLGILNGKAEQLSQNSNLSFYQQNQPDISSTWGVNYYNYKSEQTWNNSGNLYFGGFDIFHKINEDINLIGYFNYMGGNIDFKNSSYIKDTSFYYSKYNYQWYNDNYWDKVTSTYSLSDNRVGSGTKKKSDYSGLIGFRWQISPKLKVTFGLAYFEYNLEINSKEPVIYEAISKYNRTTNNPNNSNQTSYLRIYEDKKIEWHYNSTTFSYQIPIIFDFKLSEKVEITLLVNQISGGSKINEYTNAFINTRIRTENDSTKQFGNFLERYLNPAVNNTFEKTDLIGSFKFYLHPNLNFNFLIDPELVPFINVSQWWFSIEGRF